MAECERCRTVPARTDPEIGLVLCERCRSEYARTQLSKDEIHNVLRESIFAWATRWRGEGMTHDELLYCLAWAFEESLSDFCQPSMLDRRSNA